MRIVFLDLNDIWTNLLPITFTRPISELRLGILTIREKWEILLNTKQIAFYTMKYLQEKYALQLDEENIIINSALLPDEKILSIINNLPKNTAYYNNEKFLFGKIDKNHFNPPNFKKINRFEYKEPFTILNNLWEIYRLNDKQIEFDFKLLTKNKKSQPIDNTNTVYQPERIFVEPGAKIFSSILNPNDGYIYIGKNALIMEGATIRGSLAMCQNSVVKMQAKIYGATTIGPFSKIGGEVNNSVIIGYSNKAHDGFLGNAVLGEWCNLGADTNNSNLKNNYKPVKIWNYSTENFIDTDLQFVGLFMGDHSKTGINTMLNTGTVVGVSANIFGPGFPRNFIPSFTWGGHQGYTTYRPEKAMETANLMMQRRNRSLTDIDKKILFHIFEITKKYRQFDH